jgi:hypothetical protein
MTIPVYPPKEEEIPFIQQAMDPPVKPEDDKR